MEEDLHVKATFLNENRRFTFSSTPSLEEAVVLLLKLFHLPQRWSLCYMDDEGDWILIVDSNDWTVALSFAKENRFLRLRISAPYASTYEPISISDSSVKQSNPTSNIEEKQQSLEEVNTAASPIPIVPSQEIAAPSTIRESCDVATRKLQSSVSMIHRGMASECNTTFNETLEKCNSLYDSERECYSRIAPPRLTPLYEEVFSECDRAVQAVVEKHQGLESHASVNGTLPSQLTIANESDESVQEMLARMAKVSLQISEQCKQLSDEIVNTAMKM